MARSCTSIIFSRNRLFSLVCSSVQQERARLRGGLQAEAGGQLEQVFAAGAEPGEVRQGLGEEDGVASLASDPNTDQITFIADGQEIDFGLFREEAFGHDPKCRIEMPQAMPYRPAQRRAIGLAEPFKISQGLDSSRLHRAGAQRP